MIEKLIPRIIYCCLMFIYGLVCIYSGYSLLHSSKQIISSFYGPYDLGPYELIGCGLGILIATMIALSSVDNIMLHTYENNKKLKSLLQQLEFFSGTTFIIFILTFVGWFIY